jgi:transposase
MQNEVYVGLDVHRKTTTVCILDPALPEEGGRFRNLTIATCPNDFRRVFEALAGRCRVVFEVGPLAQWLYRTLRTWTSQIQVANSSRVPWLFRDGRKNDRLDARKLALLLYLDQVPQVWLPPAEVAAWRALINERRSLVRKRTTVKNQIRALLTVHLRTCPFRSCWSKAGRAWLAAQVFDALYLGTWRRLLAQLALLDTHVKYLEQQLDTLAAGEPGVALLRTIPGIGPRSAEAIVAFTAEVGRFRDRKRFASYFGMVPTQDSSGERVRFGHISKRGPSVVRWVLIEGVRSAIRHSPGVRAYYERIARGRADRRKKAVVATGRKLLAICFGMLRTGEEFDPARLETRRSPGPAPTPQAA